MLASSEELKKSVAPRKPVSRPVADPPAPEIAKPAAGQPTYQVFMPPLRYDSSAKVQDEPDPKLIVMVRRVVIPLLEWLDREGITRRLPDDRRLMREPPGSPRQNGEQ